MARLRCCCGNLNKWTKHQDRRSFFSAIRYIYLSSHNQMVCRVRIVRGRVSLSVVWEYRNIYKQTLEVESWTSQAPNSASVQQCLFIKPVIHGSAILNDFTCRNPNDNGDGCDAGLSRPRCAPPPAPRKVALCARCGLPRQRDVPIVLASSNTSS